MNFYPPGQSKPGGLVEVLGLFYLSEHFLDLRKFERRDDEIVFVGMKLHAREARLVHVPELAVNLDEVAFSEGTRYSRFVESAFVVCLEEADETAAFLQHGELSLNPA